VFIEGWAFYCEQLMKEMGYFDISGQFAQLEAQLWRAARVVVDVGLHTGRMTFDQAVDFMVKRAHAAKVSTEAEVRRYVRTPTQPMSYYIGKLEILKIREAFKEKMKDAFTLKEFHHQLLSSGSLPPALIRYRMGLGSLPGLAAVGDTAGFCPPAG